MGLRRSGFALMVVLIAVAAVFALALRGATLARATSLEVGAIHGRVLAERHARAAAAIALEGIVPADALAADADTGFPSGADPAQAPVAPTPEEREEALELPEFLKELIPELAEVEDRARQDLSTDEAEAIRVADGRGMTGRTPPRAGISERLAGVGLPAGPIRVEFDGRAYRVRMWDALGILNINRAGEEQLVRYFRRKGADTTRATALAHQVIDWRDADQLQLPRGAEQDVYNRRNITCRNAEIHSLEELLFLPAMDRELFERIEDELAVGGDAMVHVGSAPPDVLASVPGMTDEAVGAILALRRGGRISEQALFDALPIMHRDALMQKLRIELSGVVRLRVDALEGPNDRVIARFDGIAFVSGQRVREIGLRPI